MVTLTGVGDLNDPAGEAIGADQLVVHPDWNPDSLTGDALLIHLRTRSSAPPHAVAQPGGRYYTEPNVPNAAGWGATDEKAEIGTELLKDAYLEIQDDDTCAFYARGFDAATQTCAGTKDTAGACKGDSGGPLIVFDEATDAPVLFGLTSYGPQIGLGLNVCALKAPAVFPWVPGFSKFISETLNPPPSQQPAPGPAQPGGRTVIPARPETGALQALARRRRCSRQRGAPGRRGVQDRALGRQTAMMSRIEMMPWTSPFSTTTR